VAVVDWPSVAAAPGVIDVSYFLGTSMTETERQTHERELVTEYHERPSSYGVQNYTVGECRREYRAHALFGLINRITTPEHLVLEVDALIEVILVKDPFTLRRTNKYLNTGSEIHISGALAFESEAAPGRWARASPISPTDRQESSGASSRRASGRKDWTMRRRSVR
jgi:hypothetical protein